MVLKKNTKKITWKDIYKKSKEDVLDEARVVRSLEFVGHLNRHKSIKYSALTGKKYGKRREVDKE